MSDSGMGVLLGGLIALATIWVQAVVAVRMQKMEFKLEKNKTFWEFDLEAYKELEGLLVFFIHDTAYEFDSEEIGSEMLRTHQEKRKEYLVLLRRHEMLFPEIEKFMRIWARLMSGRVGISMSVEQKEGGIPFDPSKEIVGNERMNLSDEMYEEARHVLQSVRLSFLGETAAVKGLSVASLDSQWQQIRSKLPWNLERSEGE